MLIYLRNYWPLISIILTILIFFIFIYKKVKASTIKKIILSLVIQAEKSLGSKTGELKYALVIEGLYKILPLPLKLLFTRKQINIFIEEAVDFLKVYLSDDKDLIGYDNENLKVYLDNINL